MPERFLGILEAYATKFRKFFETIRYITYNKRNVYVLLQKKSLFEAAANFYSSPPFEAVQVIYV